MENQQASLVAIQRSSATATAGQAASFDQLLMCGVITEASDYLFTVIWLAVGHRLCIPSSATPPTHCEARGGGGPCLAAILSGKGAVPATYEVCMTVR
jgi:hypothetical protein